MWFVSVLLGITVARQGGVRVLAWFLSKEVSVMNRFRLLAMALMMTSSLACGSLVGSDHAGNYSAWTNLSSGGTGFQPWSFSSVGLGAQSLADSSLGLNGNSDLNTGGQAFTLSSGSAGGDRAVASRLFDGGALAFNQTFEIQLGANYVNAGSKYCELTDASGTPLYYFSFTYEPFMGEPMYVNNGNLLMWNWQADSIVTLSLTRTHDLDYWVTLDRNGGDSWSGSVTLAAEVAGVQLSANRTGAGATHDFYVNNMSLSAIPEPATLALAGAGLLVMWRKGRRQISKSKAT